MIFGARKRGASCYTSFSAFVERISTMIASGGLVPHPPLLVPEIGRENFADVAATVAAMEKLADLVCSAKPDLLIMSSPHHPRARPDSVGIVSAAKLKGDFGRFGASQVRLEFDGSPDAAKLLLETELPLQTQEIETGDLDWGFTVFLNYLRRTTSNTKLLPLSMTWGSPRSHFEFGNRLAKVLAQSLADYRIAYVASGDLSHCTRRGIGREYDPYGRVFDDLVVKAVKTRDTGEFLSLSEAELARARQCGAMSYAAAMGFYSSVECDWNYLSYEDPFGVGYLVAGFEVIEVA
jgi:aromatic ring-opening dioxygenase LigB subunit